MAFSGSFTLRPEGRPDRTALPGPRRDATAGAGRGGARRQEYPDRTREARGHPRRPGRRGARPLGPRQARPPRAHCCGSPPRRQVHPAARPRLAHLLGRPPPDRSEAGRAGRGGRPVQPGGRPLRGPGAAPGPRPVPRRHPPHAWSAVRPVPRRGGGRRGPRRPIPLQGRRARPARATRRGLGLLPLAGPGGDQVVATFTLADTRVKPFGAEDERLIATFRWEPAPASGPEKEKAAPKEKAASR